MVPESRDPLRRQLVEELAREHVLVCPATLGGVADLEVKRGRPEQLDVSAHGFHTRARDGAGVQIAEAVDGALPIRAHLALRILA